MSNILNNKVALITGGSSGIGAATAYSFAKAGAAVMIGARRETEGQAVVEQIRAAGGQAHFLATDVTDAGQVKALVAATEKQFGGLDIAFNNAGTEGAGLFPMVEETEANLRSVMEVNFFGLWYSMQAELPALEKRGGGVIINTSSVAGLRGFPAFSSYVSSKFAVEGLTRSVAQEAASLGIRVNAVNPGPIDTDLIHRATGGDPSGFTDMVPMQRLGTVEEVAELVTFLASDKGSFISGSSIRVDGAMLS